MARNLWLDTHWTEKIPANSAISRAVHRGNMLPAKAYKCAGCNEKAKDFHHASYHKEDWLCVVPLCRSCHQFVHQSDRQITFGVVPTAVGLIRIAIANAQEQP